MAITTSSHAGVETVLKPGSHRVGDKAASLLSELGGFCSQRYACVLQIPVDLSTWVCLVHSPNV